MTFVLDASAVLGALAPDEDGDLGAAALARVELGGALVPPGFVDEIVHAAANGVRMRRWSDGVARRIVEAVAALDITVIDRPFPTVNHLEVALATGLTGADAAYLHLATQVGVPLVTADGDLREAAGRFGVVCL